jgi:hypothetical protein
VRGFAGSADTPFPKHQSLKFFQGPTYVRNVPAARQTKAAFRRPVVRKASSGTEAGRSAASKFQSSELKRSAGRRKWEKTSENTERKVRRDLRQEVKSMSRAKTSDIGTPLPKKRSRDARPGFSTSRAAGK